MFPEILHKSNKLKRTCKRWVDINLSVTHWHPVSELDVGWPYIMHCSHHIAKFFGCTSNYATSIVEELIQGFGINPGAMEKFPGVTNCPLTTYS